MSDQIPRSVHTDNPNTNLTSEEKERGQQLDLLPSPQPIRPIQPEDTDRLPDSQASPQSEDHPLSVYFRDPSRGDLGDSTRKQEATESQV